MIAVDRAIRLLHPHATAVIQRRYAQCEPTCADSVPDVAKLSALVEEVGEVARCLQDDSSPEALRSELLDVATAAALWAQAVALTETRP